MSMDVYIDSWSTRIYVQEYGKLIPGGGGQRQYTYDGYDEWGHDKLLGPDSYRRGIFMGGRHHPLTKWGKPIPQRFPHKSGAVCVCGYTHSTYTHTHIHVHMLHVHTHTTHVCVWVYIQDLGDNWISSFSDLCMCMCLHVCVCVCVCIHIHIYIYIIIM
jgi:hypothetical protein